MAYSDTFDIPSIACKCALVLPVPWMVMLRVMSTPVSMLKVPVGTATVSLVPQNPERVHGVWMARMLSVFTALANVQVLLTVTVAAFAVDALAVVNSSAVAKVAARALAEKSPLIVDFIGPPLWWYRPF